MILKSNATVSYTHLRAHETVLDLVCRLLLEKKKNIIQQLNLVIHKVTEEIALIQGLRKNNATKHF